MLSLVERWKTNSWMSCVQASTPAKTGLINLTNGEAKIYGHDISSGQRQSSKTGRRADDVDYSKSTVRYIKCRITMGNKLSTYWVSDWSTYSKMTRVNERLNGSCKAVCHGATHLANHCLLHLVYPPSTKLFPSHQDGRPPLTWRYLEANDII
jgi:hypothetical protein